MNLCRLIVNSLIYFGPMKPIPLAFKLKTVIPDLNETRLRLALSELQSKGFIRVDYSSETYSSRVEWGDYVISQNSDF